MACSRSHRIRKMELQAATFELFVALAPLFSVLLVFSLRLQDTAVAYIPERLADGNTMKFLPY